MGSNIGRNLPAKKAPEFAPIPISLEEANEFLYIIQQSEFKIVEQLNKNPARVSLLKLLMSSERHRAFLF